MNNPRPRPIVAFVALTLSLAGCTTFSSLEPPVDDPDAGVGEPDAGAPADAGPEPTDAGPEPTDAGPPPVLLANSCSAEMPFLDPNPMPRMFMVGDLSDTLSSFSSCSATEPLLSRDGFFELAASAGDRWHVMVRPTQPDQDVAVYYLSSCDERTCRKMQNGCGAGQPEHSNFVATDAMPYIVGVESSTDAPVMVMVMKPACGNGMLNHGETCDDGNTRDADGCDTDCRAELLGSDLRELEPNNDLVEANVLMAGSATGLVTVTGNLGGPCDRDRYAFDVPEGGSITASVLTPAGAACDTSFAEVSLTLLEPDERGGFLGAGTTAGAGGECPSIEVGTGFATGLSAGEYQLEVTAPPGVDIFEYVLRVEVVPAG